MARRSPAAVAAQVVYMVTGAVVVFVALVGVAAADGAISASGDDPSLTQPSWVEPIVLLTAIWTVPFIVFLARRFRRTWLSPVSPAATR